MELILKLGTQNAKHFSHQSSTAHSGRYSNKMKLIFIQIILTLLMSCTSTFTTKDITSKFLNETDVTLLGAFGEPNFEQTKSIKINSSNIG